jgi:hypothetical protein
MLKKCLLIGLLFTNVLSQAQDVHHKDPNPNITPYNLANDAKSGATTTYLQKEQAWQSFVQQYPTWGTNFSKFTQLPHRAFGEPITFLPGGNNATQKAILFLTQALQAYNIPMQELELTNERNDGTYINVNFKQNHQGMQVLWTNVTVRFTQDLKIIMFGTDVYRNIQATQIVLTPNEAKAKAEQAIVSSISNSIVSSVIKLFPIPTEEKVVFHPVYEVTVETNKGTSEVGKYMTYVDATTGDILYRDNKIKNIDVKVKADLYPTNHFGTIQNLPLKNLEVNVGTNTYYTNTNGVVTLPGAGPITATTILKGKYVNVVDNENSVVVPTQSMTFNNTGDSVILVPSAVPNTAHYGIYYHVNAIHDFMKTKFPTFTALDYPLPALVQRTDGTCNAFYNGNSINFYEAGGGCADMSFLSDVAYHEYGHGINDFFYTDNGSSFDNGGMGEGYADAWAFCLNSNPIIGSGFNNTAASSIRIYNAAPKVYPQDLVGQVHADGEIIAGAWWDVGVNWNRVDSMGDLFAKTFYGLATGPNGTEGQVYLDILIDALNYDDNDGNLNNGTPHMNYIVAGFARHGISLLSDATVINNVASSLNSIAPIPISADVTAAYPMFLGNLKMFYRLKGTALVDSLLLVKTNQNYIGNMPGKNVGDIVEYYYQLYDNSDFKATQFPFASAFTLNPITERNIPFHLMVGYSLYTTHDFETGTPSGYTVGNLTGDLATAGKWKVDTLIPSYTNGDIVQSDKDHTIGNGNKCAFTGNALSPTSSVGSADVDGGRTSLATSDFNIQGLERPVLSYWRWFSNSQGSNARKDQWRVYISYNSGSTWSLIPERTYQPDVSWRQNVYKLDNTKSVAALKFVASDSAQTGFNGGSLVEAAVDDIQLWSSTAPANVNNKFELQSNVYPNPLNNKVNIALNTSGITTIKIINQVGQILYIKEENITANKPVEINTSTFSNGMYFIEISRVNSKTTKKITIQH